MKLFNQPMFIGTPPLPQGETRTTINPNGSGMTPPFSGDEKLTQFKPTGSTGRPSNDNRRAAQIFDDNPIIQRFFENVQELTHCGHHILQALKRRLGDWTANNRNSDARADAAYNLARVLNYLDKNPNLHRSDEALNPSEADHLTGYLPSDEHPRNEYNALIAFALGGYADLPEAYPVKITKWSNAEAAAEAKAKASVFPSADEKRPPLDRRDAFAIYDQHNIASFTDSHHHAAPDENKLLNQLKLIVGNLRSDNPDKEAQADAAYRLARVTDFLSAQIKPDRSNLQAIKDTFIAFSRHGYPALEKYRNTDSNDPTSAGRTEPKKDTPPPPTATAPNHPAAESPHDFIQTEKDTDLAPTHATGRPEGDHRTADQIIRANPIFNYLPVSIPAQNLYRYLGDWTSNNPDPQKRADAAYNAARLFNYIDASDLKGPHAIYNRPGNAKIEGEIVSPLPEPFDDAYIEDDDGSEAALLKKFSEKGYSALAD